MSSPKVSVITPAFNAEGQIEVIIRIVGEQVYPSIEHIVVNDGSSDQTADVLDNLLRKWPSLRVVSQSNQGRSAARNRGMAESNGDYLLFLDDDDALDANAISEMVKKALKNPGAVVYTGWKMKYASGLTTKSAVNLRNRKLFETTAFYCPFVIHGCLVPRIAMVEANGFDETLDFAEDWDLWQRLGRAGVPFVGVSKPLVTYNLPQRNLSSESAHMQYQQLRTVIDRAFERDDRVKSPVPEFKHGCTVGCAEEGLISALLWFAGIEYAQNANFSWLTECAGEISSRSNYVPISVALASAFCSGISYGRGRGGLDAAAPEFPRLQELAAVFGVDDPSTLVPRLALPAALPLAVAEVQHFQLGLKTTDLPDNKGVGRVQPWLLRNDLYRRFPAGVYAAKDEAAKLKFNLPKGIALATLDLVRDRSFVWSLPRRLVAMARQRNIVKNTLVEVAALSVDRAVEGSILTKLDLPVVKAPRTAAPVFDQIFSTEDPWGYDKPYEVRKYEETLELLVGLSADDIVTEMACAEGHFTARLAPLVNKIRAYDVSPIALERLEGRLEQAGINNVEMGVFDLLADTLTKTSDVVVCSEVLYYMPPEKLDDVVSRLVAGIRPGGAFVHAHAFEASQRGSKPGFGWRQPFGVQRISEALGSNPELQRTRVIETDLYMVERYEKTLDKKETGHEFRPIDRINLEPEIANQVLWSGYQTTPDQSNKLVTTELPVLTYHSIGENAPSALRPYQVSPDDFVEQLRWLRENGYRTPSLREVSALVRRGRPISGKAVLITFDDAYQCFADTAWQLLQNHGFTAVMFAATSYLGKAAQWDAKYGEPMKIMDGQTLSELAASGLYVGSHSTDHQPMTHVSTKEALKMMLQSKEELQDVIGKRVELFAFPYGIFDQQLGRLAKHCGYSLAFSLTGCHIKPFDNPHTLGRFIVDGTKPPLDSLLRLPGHRRVSTFRRSMDHGRKTVVPKLRNLLKR